MNSDDVTLLNYKHCHTCGARMDGKDGMTAIKPYTGRGLTKTERRGSFIRRKSARPYFSPARRRKKHWRR